MFFYSLDKVLERISICPLFSEGCAVSYCSEMAQSKSILHTFIPASHFLLLGLSSREKHEPNITNQLLPRSNVFRQTPLALVNFILFQSAASWTWSHTCLSVPCIVPASSAAHRFVFWVHSSPGTERTERREISKVKRIITVHHICRESTSAWVENLHRKRAKWHGWSVMRLVPAANRLFGPPSSPGQSSCCSPGLLVSLK